MNKYFDDQDIAFFKLLVLVGAVTFGTLFTIGAL